MSSKLLYQYADAQTSPQIPILTEETGGGTLSGGGHHWLTPGGGAMMIFLGIGAVALSWAIWKCWKKDHSAKGPVVLTLALLCWAAVLWPLGLHLHPLLGQSGFPFHIAWTILPFFGWIVGKLIPWIEIDDKAAAVFVFLGFVIALALQGLFQSDSFSPFWWLLVFAWSAGYSEAIWKSQWGADSPGGKWMVLILGWAVIFCLA